MTWYYCFEPDVRRVAASHMWVGTCRLGVVTGGTKKEKRESYVTLFLTLTLIGFSPRPRLPPSGLPKER